MAALATQVHSSISGRRLADRLALPRHLCKRRFQESPPNYFRGPDCAFVASEGECGRRCQVTFPGDAIRLTGRFELLTRQLGGSTVAMQFVPDQMNISAGIRGKSLDKSAVGAFDAPVRLNRIVIQ